MRSASRMASRQAGSAAGCSGERYARDLRFARDGHAVVKIGKELHILVRDRQDAPGDGEHLAHTRDGLVEGIAHAVERSEKEIAEALAAQRTVLESIGEQRLHRRLGVRKRL